ncbi:MAG: hypothetical protein EB127_20245, partial [Alphaproteobacteria bacterium]|nr:hypothetical protein [Alphaproteobacteria bacterium]
MEVQLYQEFTSKWFVLIRNKSNPNSYYLMSKVNIVSFKYIANADSDTYLVYRDGYGRRSNPIDKTRFLGILLFSGILARANSDKELNRLKPWVLEVRGHYADVQVNDIELSRLRTLMGIDLEGTEINCCSVHYRLGDLIHLESKSY